MYTNNTKLIVIYEEYPHFPQEHQLDKPWFKYIDASQALCQYENFFYKLVFTLVLHELIVRFLRAPKRGYKQITAICSILVTNKVSYYI